MFKFVSKEVPYTTPKGIHIGLLYEKPLDYVSDWDATFIQTCMLGYEYKPTFAEKLKKIFWE